jgi:hypothetical protein
MDLFTFLVAGPAAAAVLSAATRGDSKQAPAPAGTVEDLRSALDDLRTRTERLALVNMALWSLLRDRLGVSDEDLEKRIEEVDLSDGKLDGKITRTVVKCLRCSRMVSRRHKKCLYCGAERADFSPFDATG